MVEHSPAGTERVMFRRILIANRGEIAVRIARTCHDLGIEVVAVYSDVDAKARHVAAADEAVPLPGVSPVETYLNVGAIVGSARRPKPSWRRATRCRPEGSPSRSASRRCREPSSPCPTPTRWWISGPGS